MDFTREPIIESVVTPKEGSKLVVRSSKGVTQEEYFVDAVEMVTFGHTLFYRSLEKPKAFLVPASDYEILEVREARMILKNVGLERSIKIGGGKEALKPPPLQSVEKNEPAIAIQEKTTISPIEAGQPAVENKLESRIDKKRERRRHYRRRRGREDVGSKEEGWTEDRAADLDTEEGIAVIGTDQRGRRNFSEEDTEAPVTVATGSSSILSSLLPPPPTLISETIARYRENESFKGVFFSKADDARGEEEASEEDISAELSLTSHYDLFSEDGKHESQHKAESEDSSKEKSYSVLGLTFHEIFEDDHVLDHPGETFESKEDGGIEVKEPTKEGEDEKKSSQSEEVNPQQQEQELSFEQAQPEEVESSNCVVKDENEDSSNVEFSSHQEHEETNNKEPTNH